VRTTPIYLNGTVKVGYGYICVMGIDLYFNKLHYLGTVNFKSCQCHILYHWAMPTVTTSSTSKGIDPMKAILFYNIVHRVPVRWGKL